MGIYCAFLRRLRRRRRPRRPRPRPPPCRVEFPPPPILLVAPVALTGSTVALSTASAADTGKASCVEWTVAGKLSYGPAINKDGDLWTFALMIAAAVK